jgi:chemotaxis family two-component system response regulator Rcp1
MNVNTQRDSIVILLVEDSPGDVRLTQEAFRAGRVCNQIHVVNDGVEAMNYLRRQGRYAGSPRPDIILLDLNLPRKDGREVLAEIKSDDSLRHIPVIILTTSDAEADILKSYDLHANCYLVKPVDINRFFALVQSIEGFWLSIVKLPVTQEKRAAA